jgi:hypothetical protein
MYRKHALLFGLVAQKAHDRLAQSNIVRKSQWPIVTDVCYGRLAGIGLQRAAQKGADLRQARFENNDGICHGLERDGTSSESALNCTIQFNSASL